MGERKKISRIIQTSLIALNNQITSLSDERDEELPLLNEAKERQDEKKTTLEKFDDKFKHQSVDQSKQHSKTLEKLAVIFCQETFNKLTGDLRSLKYAARVTRLSNPILVKDQST